MTDLSFPRPGLVIDLFAGGGGASLGIEMALGRSPDIAINHDPLALAIHAANHPGTRHLQTSVWRADPRDVTSGRPVALLWASPDCKHFSKAKGSAPASRHIRDLAWVVVLWAQRARPAVIILENVEEFRTWGPVLLDGRPCPDRAGITWAKWVRELRRLGYRVDHRELRACDYGAPTIRKRLFVVARCDGQPIVWPSPTHRSPGAQGTLPLWRTAAECIDWSIPCPSIFARKRPLAENTCRRIAIGIRRYVLEAGSPFIVGLAHGAHADRPGPGDRSHGMDEPLRTIHAGGGNHALVAAFLAQHNGGTWKGQSAREMTMPVSTITVKGSHQALVAAHLMNMKGADRSSWPADGPAPTITAGATHVAEVRAFLVKWHGTAIGQDLREPAHTITTKHRLGLVTIHGQEYQIVDIGMRMLEPRELARAQGFPDSYVLDRGPAGEPLTKTAQVRMIGNSVCPPIAATLVKANAGAIPAAEAAA